MSDFDFMSEDFKELSHKMEKVMDKKRYVHTIGVAHTAACMAMCHDINPYKAYLAGLLHDNAKCISEEKKLSICAKYGIEITKAEKANHDLLHAKVGSILAKEKYDIKDEEILSAIFYHTTGKPAMTTLEKIIYIADYIEIGRKKQKNMDLVRKLAFSDLDKCMCVILKGTLQYLEDRHAEIDSLTNETYSYYQNRMDSCL